MRLPRPSAPHGNPTIKTFQDLLREDSPDDCAVGTLVDRLSAEGLAEEAFAELKRLRPGSSSPKDLHWHQVRTRLEQEAQQSREKRILAWQLDPKRRTLRLRLEVLAPACDLNPSALLHALNQALLAAGVPVAMGLEKKPRPMTSLGPPLPLKVEGLGEWADCVLRGLGSLPLESLPSRVSAHCPPGLRVLSAATIPNHSSSLLELAQEGRWCWDCPVALEGHARTRLGAFLDSDSFEIEKAGKQDGAKSLKRIEVRAFVKELTWEGSRVVFTTRFKGGDAPSPLKLLAGILGIAHTDIRGLRRLGVDLGPDPRVEAPQKYEPKLHNIYEDAVLLESPGPLQVVDEDDDELLLNR